MWNIFKIFTIQKMIFKNLYLCIFSKILKNTILIKNSNFRLRKTCVSYQPCAILIRLRDRELNHVLLHTFLNERKWNIQDGGLKPEVDTVKRLFPFPHLIATRYTDIPMFSGSAIPMGHVSVRTTKLGGNRKWKIQDGGLHPWNAYISPPRVTQTS